MKDDILIYLHVCEAIFSFCSINLSGNSFRVGHFDILFDVYMINVSFLINKSVVTSAGGY